MSRVKAVVVAASVVLVAALAIVLSGAPLTVAAINTPAFLDVASTRKGLRICQPGEVLPRDTSAIRIQMFASTGPRVAVAVSAHGRVVARGERKSAWTGGAVTVPVRPLSVSQSDATVCFAFPLNGHETINLRGQPSEGPLVARTRQGRLPGRVRLEYLRPGGASWWSISSEVARRMGLGHAASGTWGVILVIFIVAGVALLSMRTVLTEIR